MKRTDLSNIMRMAWRFYRTTRRAFAECLKLAWRNFNLVRRMHTEVVRFYFRKVDGTLRKACGTLHDVAATVKGTGRLDDGRTVKYYDTEAAGWRSFKVENLVTVY